MSGNLELKRRVVSAIESSGGELGFDVFMGMVLYDVEEGYYARAEAPQDEMDGGGGGGGAGGRGWGGGWGGGGGDCFLKMVY
jgi:hypothetical protein